jgi:hypothetical protein
MVCSKPPKGLLKRVVLIYSVIFKPIPNPSLKK